MQLDVYQLRNIYIYIYIYIQHLYLKPYLKKKTVKLYVIVGITIISLLWAERKKGGFEKSLSVFIYDKYLLCMI